MARRPPTRSRRLAARQFPGAVVTGVLTDANGASVDVPVESVMVVEAGDVAMMVAAEGANVAGSGALSVPADSRFGFAGGGLGENVSVQVYVMSTPTLVAEFDAAANGTFSLSGNLFAAIPSGDHTLVLATEAVQVSMGIQVEDADVARAPSLPSTGSPMDSVALVVLLVAAGLLVCLVTRERSLS